MSNSCGEEKGKEKEEQTCERGSDCEKKGVSVSKN